MKPEPIILGTTPILQTDSFKGTLGRLHPAYEVSKGNRFKYWYKQENDITIDHLVTGHNNMWNIRLDQDASYQSNIDLAYLNTHGGY